MADAKKDTKNLETKIKKNIKQYIETSKKLKKYQSEYSRAEIDNVRALIELMIEEMKELSANLGKNEIDLDIADQSAEINQGIFNHIKIISELLKSYDLDISARSSFSNGLNKAHVEKIKKHFNDLLEAVDPKSRESPNLKQVAKLLREGSALQNKFYQQEKLKINAVIFKVERLMNIESNLNPLNKLKKEFEKIYSELKKMQKEAYKNPAYINAEAIEDRAKGRIDNLILKIKNSGDEKLASAIKEQFFSNNLLKTNTKTKQTSEVTNPKGTPPLLLSKSTSLKTDHQNKIESEVPSGERRTPLGRPNGPN